MKDDEFHYIVRIYDLKDDPGVQVFTFVPQAGAQPPGTGEFPKRAPQYIVRARASGGDIHFDWGSTPDEPGDAKSKLEEDASRRMNSRFAWVKRIQDLVAQVELWAKELGWDTRTIEKRLDDSYVGKHTTQALLMQEETCRILLEPVGRSAPGAEGLVDLYLLPAYDDIASLYFYDGRWNVHYYFSGEPTTGNIRDMPAKALSKETLRTVLEEMRANAA
jgi:hypothetical protein